MIGAGSTVQPIAVLPAAQAFPPVIVSTHRGFIVRAELDPRRTLQTDRKASPSRAVAGAAKVGPVITTPGELDTLPEYPARVSLASLLPATGGGLLQFARQNKVALQPTNLCELVDRSLQAMQIPNNIEVRIEHDLEDPIAEIDPDQIVQVLANIVTNAIAAMPEGGTLTVKTGGDDSSVQLIVSDTGVGIPQEHLRKIFEPFFTTKQIGKGTGLGLAIVARIAELHGGHADVQAAPDGGA